ncbi:conserved hypothetical protein [Streptomyces himastatinicus ATCC 53653]|uniref:DUF2267 domain-containing protein n=1 Tax=Streptomyces himastatinicus ATCC 53653 TaxID=457427 RepID=D9WDT8_9ACTN|nr:DUF2267 domain-containing protein [Streptomyces himastatinicus]EFL20998.1 conserved hypothetical protein [Streptomyces himastatinicus ATCC 53653]
MRYEELTGQVQARAQLPDRQAAERTVRATLETLAERIPGGLADHLAAQLPAEAAEPIRRVTASHEGSPEQRAHHRDHGERFGLTGFAGRIAWRTESTEEEAIREASAFFEVLDSAVDPELMEKVYGVLPNDIRELLPEARAVQSEGAGAGDAGARSAGAGETEGRGGAGG